LANEEEEEEVAEPFSIEAAARRGRGRCMPMRERKETSIPALFFHIKATSFVVVVLLLLRRRFYSQDGKSTDRKRDSRFLSLRQPFLICECVFSESSRLFRPVDV